MAFDRFIVVSVNRKTNFGYARQMTSENSAPLATLIGFDGNRASEMVIFDGETEPGYSLPSPAIAQRQPQIDTVLVGSIARDIVHHQIELGPDGNPFLRNWGYADQYDEAKQGTTNDVDFDDEFENSQDDYDPMDGPENCEGGCGQTKATCTCAELESLMRHNADPATRGSWWVA